jgi:hypothetical protein
MFKSLFIRHFRIWFLPVLWFIFAFWMWKDWNAPHPIDTPEHMNGYGFNQSGTLRLIILISSVELIFVQFMIRAWAKERSPLLEFIAWGVMTFWLFITILMSMHGGGVIMLHLLWVFILEGWLSVHLLFLLWEQLVVPKDTEGEH